MRKKEVMQILKQLAKLLLLHGESPFRVKHYEIAARKLQQNQLPKKVEVNEISQHLGISTKIAGIIHQALHTGTTPLLNELLAKTPKGLIDLLEIGQLGPQRLRTLWQQLDITTPAMLLEACANNRIAGLKGFGPKTQAILHTNTQFFIAHQGCYHYATAIEEGKILYAHLRKLLPTASMSFVGGLRRCTETVTHIPILVGTEEIASLREWLAHTSLLRNGMEKNGAQHKENLTFYWQGHSVGHTIPVQIYACSPRYFTQQLLLLTGSEAHLNLTNRAGITLRNQALASLPVSEESFYKQNGHPCYPPALREGVLEKTWTSLPNLLTFKDLKGVLHCHTNYSDGQDTLETMAQHAQASGYTYIGITDHSQAAVYAGGLSIAKVLEQHQAIDALNEKMAFFKIFKGIEADILPDGNLDYPDEVLANFDFVIASVHSMQNMDKATATARLLKAIANPYTTILGHATGRILLRRPGYPIDHQVIIDACAQYGVAIELNANPWRLDMEWRWLPYALSKGIYISINPDAHEKEGIAAMQYGVAVARKGGLTAARTLNAMSLQAITTYFARRKARHLPAQ